MFKSPTVFILGAGASWHYGYPTGEELVKRIIEKAQWPAPGSEDTKLGVLMEREVRHGAAEVHARVQA